MTLVFSSRTAARTVTPTGTTQWVLRLDKGGSTAVPGPVGNGDGVVATVLEGTSTWQIVGDTAGLAAWPAQPDLHVGCATRVKPSGFILDA